MTGTGISVISNDDASSYNRAVAVINQKQKENVVKLERALAVANANNTKLQTSIDNIQDKLKDLKKQVYVNQCLIDNWDKEAPYSYPVEMLD